MKDKNIPINKGNYSSFETPEREESFELYKSVGWEEEYAIYRTNWSKFPKEQIVDNYPLLVDIELSSLCNLKCPMCYTITDKFKEKVNARLMDFELFKKIIDEIGNNVSAVRLSLRGEPTLHPSFIECISYAKDKGIKEVSLLTNGSKLEIGFFEKMVKAGIDWITISIDGIAEEYEKIRKPLKFNGTLKKLKDIKQYKENNNLIKPVIKIQGIWPSIKNNPSGYYNALQPYSDLIAFNPLIDYLQKDGDIIYVENFSCPQLYQRMVIGADGYAMMCSNDEEGDYIIGNVYKETVREIWHGNKLNKAREIHKRENGFLEFSVCKKCYLPRAIEAIEKSEVNGREFAILNYINRSQYIGE